MEKKFIIGVDGGGTKTDYLLFTTEGEWVDSLHVGSRSHEKLPGGFAEVEKTVLIDLETLLAKNSINKSQIEAAVFGLAGIDTPAQLAQITEIIGKSGLNNFIVANDSVLGIKAGCPSGIGICSINGTGTVVTGINESGEIQQIGGVGYASGDSAGGVYIASMVIRAVYDYYFRCGLFTSLTDKIMKLFEISEPLELLNVISEQFEQQRNLDISILTILFEAANAEDEVAVNLVCEVSEQLAKSVAGCIKALHYEGVPETVLAGSVWTKSKCPLLISHFIECVHRYSGKRIEPIRLKVIPAVGAIIWALELAQLHPATPEQRLFITEQVGHIG